MALGPSFDDVRAVLAEHSPRNWTAEMAADALDDIATAARIVGDGDDDGPITTFNNEEARNGQIRTDHPHD